MTNKETYLYLDINSKLDQNFFQKPDVFFKIVNLHKKHPLIQIGNHVFEGTYRDNLGTKVFFVEDEDPLPEENVFVKQTPIHLKYLCKTVKTLQLKWQRIPTDVTHVEPTELLDVDFNENYNAVLRKLEKGHLYIENVAVNSSEPEPVKPIKDSESRVTINLNKAKNSVPMKVEDGLKDTEVKSDDTLGNQQRGCPLGQTPADIYCALKELATMPSKRKEEFQKVYEISPNHLTKVDNAKDFVVLEQLFLQSLSFNHLPLDIDKGQFDQYVNIEKSIKDGIISAADAISITEEHKKVLLSAKNFENFSVPMKLTYLTEQLKEQKELLKKMSSEELSTVDEYGRTPKDRHRLLKRLTKDIWYYVYSHYADD